MGMRFETGTPEADIAEAVEQYADDRAFWRFVTTFAETVGYDFVVHGEPRRTARLVAECARHYAYLRNEHPGYFAKLSMDNGDAAKAIVHVADVAVLSGLPPRHFAGDTLFGTVYQLQSERAEALRKSEAEAEAEARKQDQMSRFQAAAAEIGKNPPEVAMPQDGFAIPKGPLSTEDLEELAAGFYEASKGRLIKVRSHVPAGGDNFGYERSSKVFRNYDIAIVDEGGEDAVGLTAQQGKVAESAWPVVMLTGPDRGKKASVAAPDFHEDGSITENDVVVLSLPGFILRERLSDDELVELVRLDMVDYAERAIDVTAATAYLAGTDDQTEVFFDPPLEAVVHPFDDEMRSFSSMYRIDDWNQREGINVIDVYIDFESTEERADAYRSMWTHGVSYTSHGIMEVGETPLLPFIPKFVGRKKNPDAELSMHQPVQAH
jgi:hypothetical protein